MLQLEYCHYGEFNVHMKCVPFYCDIVHELKEPQMKNKGI
jgi:hypothetical protein